MKEEKALTVLRALREAVFNDTPKRVAYRLGIPLYQLYLMLSEDSLRKRRPKFPAVYIPYLVEVVGDAPIEAICEACGGVFLRLPKETTRSKEVIEELSLLLRLTAHAPTHLPGLVELDGWDDDRKKIPLLVVGSQIKEAFLPPARLQPFVQALARGEKFEDLLALPGGCEG